jgi:hypothetical protein
MVAAYKLVVIKSVHTLIWIFFNVVLFYLLYAAVADKIDLRVSIGIGFILLEALVLLVFKNKCPLTIVARRFSDSTKDNFDIFLPIWLARHNKLIYTALFLVIAGLLVYRILS